MNLVNNESYIENKVKNNQVSAMEGGKSKKKKRNKKSNLADIGDSI